ncbi:MAG TPA: metal-dependent hydrolase [Candidatus Dojkabacteria bacterium]|nr:metal-dependent hydrolase [Candidatus Dojkabacteria bacterium]HQF36048.1 metal-dependent hydrolase [Candidatus Dojkabacteria bacterium]
MLIAHPFIGYLVGKIYQKKKSISLTDSQQVFWNVVAIIGGIGADIDFFLAPLLSVPSFRHRQLFTHTPFFWIITGICLYGAVYLLRGKLTKFKNVINPKYAKNLVIIFIFNALLHLFFDIISGAIPILWPFNSQPFTLLGYIFPHPQSSFQYFTHPTFILEFILIMLSTYTFLINNIVHKTIKKKFPIIFIFIILLSASIFLQQNSYKHDRKNINFNPDIDYDNIRNSDDNDIDGNGFLNIADLSNSETKECITNSLENIVQNKPLSIPKKLQNNSFVSNVVKLTPIIQNDMDLILKVFGECNISLENDIKADIIENPLKYNREKPSSYKDLNQTLTFNNLSTYISSHINIPIELNRGDLLITKSTDGTINGIYFVWEIDKNGENIKVISSSENWDVIIIEINNESIFKY